MLRRINLWVAVAFAAGIGVAGCANETSSPLAPEDNAPPALVTGLDAFVHVGTNPNVALHWNPGSETDLAGYRIYRSEPRYSSGSIKRGSTRIESLELDVVTASNYVDTNVHLGVSYRYAVTSFDAAGNESPRVYMAVVVAPAEDRDPGDSIH
ncbi:MAG TPA: hypothetical protein VFD07_10925 [Candidatus Krumholzibacteria bacterium]|nr:hypothetical protein [Candidatus Krumholzibacteria bacterium]